jgi:hypothetical protein
VVQCIIHIAPEDDIVSQQLVSLDVYDQVVDECFPWMNIMAALFIQLEALLMPGGDPYFIGWLWTNLVNGVDDKR